MGRSLRQVAICYTIYLDQTVHDHAGDDTSAGRKYFVEMVRENAIEGRPIARIAQPNAAADDIRLLVAGVLHDFQEIKDRSARLLDHAVDQLAVHHADLARYVQPSVGLDRMRERHALIGNSLASFSSVPLYHRLPPRRSFAGLRYRFHAAPAG